MTKTTNTTKAAKKEPINVHVKFDSKREKLVLEIPVARFKMSTMAEANLELFDTTSNGNFVVSTTSGYDSIKAEGFEHIGFTFSAVAKKRAVLDERDKIRIKKANAELAAEVQADREAKAKAPAIDMDDYEEFLEYKKWKAARAAAKK